MKAAHADDITVEFRSSAAWNVPCLQLHDYYEINLALVDAGIFFLEGKMYRLHRGTLLNISSSLLHRNVSTNPGYARCVVKFMPNLVRKFGAGQTDLLACFHTADPVLQLDEAQLGGLLDLLGRLEEVGRLQLLGWDAHQQALLVEILVLLNQISAVESSHAAHDFSGDVAALSPVLEYINGNLGDRLSLPQIAARFFISKSHLCSTFRKATGMTVGDYILHRRILLSKQLMDTSASLLEICNRCGFNSYTSFARCFKKTTGYSPKEYRAAALRSARQPCGGDAGAENAPR